MANFVEGIKGKTVKACRQLDLLAEFSWVPRRVFLQDEIPEVFDYSKTISGFRTISDQCVRSMSEYGTDDENPAP